jgi:hypothetical protein
MLAPVIFLISVIMDPPFPSRQPICCDGTRSLAGVGEVLSIDASEILEYTRTTASCAGECIMSEFCTKRYTSINQYYMFEKLFFIAWLTLEG